MPARITDLDSRVLSLSPTLNACTGMLLLCAAMMPTPCVDGVVRGLFVKPRRGEPVEPREQLSLLEHRGIEGDAHLDALSPRQVLLQSSVCAARIGASKMGQLSENIYFDAAPGSFWPPPSGSVLRLGDHAALRVTFHCEPCEHGAESAGFAAGSAGRAVFFEGWKEEGRRGVMCTVLRGGVVRLGDRVVALSGAMEGAAAVRHGPPPVVFEALAGLPTARAAQLVPKIPRGYVATYEQLCAWAGAKADGGVPSAHLLNDADTHLTSTCASCHRPRR